MARANIHLSLQGSGRGEDFWLRITTKIRESTGCVRRPLPNEFSSTILHFVCDIMWCPSSHSLLLCFLSIPVFLHSRFSAPIFVSFSISLIHFRSIHSLSLDKNMFLTSREKLLLTQQITLNCLLVALKARQMNSSVVGSTSTKLLNTHKHAIN